MYGYKPDGNDATDASTADATSAAAVNTSSGYHHPTSGTVEGGIATNSSSSNAVGVAGEGDGSGGNFNCQGMVGSLFCSSSSSTLGGTAGDLNVNDRPFVNMGDYDVTSTNVDTNNKFYKLYHSKKKNKNNNNQRKASNDGGDQACVGGGRIGEGGGEEGTNSEMVDDNNSTTSSSSQLSPSLSSSSPTNNNMSSTSNNNNNSTNNNSNSNNTTTADMLLAKELNELTLEERNDIMDEVHGLLNKTSHPNFNETEDFINTKLLELDIEIDKIYKKKRVHYDRALFLSPSRVKDKKFRIMFLRADLYDCVKAARRLIKHFEYKHVLFGESKLVQTITLADFNQDDMDTFNTGCCQFSNETRDRGGRCIFYVTQTAYKYKSWINLVRYKYCVCMCFGGRSPFWVAVASFYGGAHDGDGQCLLVPVPLTLTLFGVQHSQCPILISTFSILSAPLPPFHFTVH